MTNTFDVLHQRGRDAVVAGDHHREGRLHDGGRWGISVVLRPDAATGRRLHALTDRAMGAAGGRQWPSGHQSSSHFTVRVLEPHRVGVPADDRAVGRYREALAVAGRESAPIRLRLGGLVVTPVSVMVCAAAVDGAAARFAGALAAALGGDGWFEADSDRDIWYANVVHFADDLPDPGRLLDWVGERRHLDLGAFTAASAQLVRWDAGAGHAVPRLLGEAPLGSARAVGAGSGPVRR